MTPHEVIGRLERIIAAPAGIEASARQLVGYRTDACLVSRAMLREIITALKAKEASRDRP